MDGIMNQPWCSRLLIPQSAAFSLQVLQHIMCDVDAAILATSVAIALTLTRRTAWERGPSYCIRFCRALTADD